MRREVEGRECEERRVSGGTVIRLEKLISWLTEINLKRKENIFFNIIYSDYDCIFPKLLQMFSTSQLTQMHIIPCCLSLANKHLSKSINSNKKMKANKSE